MSKNEQLLAALEKNLQITKKEDRQVAMSQSQKDVDDDYEMSRTTYKNLINTSTEALEILLALAQDSEHPRAFEVLSTMLKNTADMTDKLMDLQIKKQHIEDDEPDAPNKVTNNLFFGSTTDLQKALLKKRNDESEDAIEAEEVD